MPEAHNKPMRNPTVILGLYPITAERKGQIVRRCGGDGVKLYSENLY